MDQDPGGIDLSPLHRELDRLKTRLCRCNHTGECLACKGFEVLRQQVQMVVAAASQPVLMQVAQEAAVKDLLAQLGGVSDKLTGDARLQELVGEMMERVQEDLGGPEAMQQMFGGLGGFPGFGGFGSPTGTGETSGRPDETPPRDKPPGGSGSGPRRDIPYDDLPPEERGGRQSG